jgi:hypothetical protein
MRLGRKERTRAGTIRLHADLEHLHADPSDRSFISNQTQMHTNYCTSLFLRLLYISDDLGRLSYVAHVCDVALTLKLGWLSTAPKRHKSP